MKITDIRIRLVENGENKVKALASMTIEGCFVVHDIRVIEGARGNFVAMPRRKLTNGEFKDIAHPIDSATRSAIETQVLEAYDKAVTSTNKGT